VRFKAKQKVHLNFNSVSRLQSFQTSQLFVTDTHLFIGIIQRSFLVLRSQEAISYVAFELIFLSFEKQQKLFRVLITIGLSCALQTTKKKSQERIPDFSKHTSSSD